MLDSSGSFCNYIIVHPQVQNFFLQKAKIMRKAEEEEERLVDFQVQFQFLGLFTIHME